MANMNIKNCDSFLASIVTVTCKSFSGGCLPFETTDIKVIWKCKLTFSAQLIIQLSGKVFLSNVKLLLTSLFEIVLLRYSTKDLELPARKETTPYGFLTEIKIFCNDYNNLSLTIDSTNANVKYIKKAGSFICQPCKQATYALNNGSLHLSTRFQGKQDVVPENTNFTC